MPLKGYLMLRPALAPQSDKRTLESEKGNFASMIL